MNAIDECLRRNARYAEGIASAELAAAPVRGLAVVACMDARMQISEMLGLAPGDAHVIRNAGGIVTDDVLRSLLISTRQLGVREVMIVNHGDCGLLKLDEEGFFRKLREEGVPAASIPLHGFADLEENVAAQAARVRSFPMLPATLAVRGFIYDVASGLLREV